MSGTHPAGKAGTSPGGASRPHTWTAEVIETEERGEQIVVRHYEFVYGVYNNVADMFLSVPADAIAQIYVKGSEDEDSSG